MTAEKHGQIKGGENREYASVCDPVAVRIVNAPPTSDDQKQTDRDNKRLQRYNFIVGVLTLLAVGYYALR
jgi:hypothetical protein